MAQIPDITDPRARLGIYEKALEMIRPGYNHYNVGLCMMLPMIWNDTKTWTTIRYNNDGDTIDWETTPEYFPEFAEVYPSTYRFDEDGEEQPHAWRITTLTTIIAELKATINEKQLQA